VRSTHGKQQQVSGLSHYCGDVARQVLSGPSQSAPLQRMPCLRASLRRFRYSRPVGECVAVAHEGRNTLAMLVRRKGETLAQLLTRLDLAIARAQTDDIFTDEINSPSK
jgi:hypothetical protein